jgi:hypothetical protein
MIYPHVLPGADVSTLMGLISAGDYPANARHYLHYSRVSFDPHGSSSGEGNTLATCQPGHFFPDRAASLPRHGSDQDHLAITPWPDLGFTREAEATGSDRLCLGLVLGAG